MPAPWPRWRRPASRVTVPSMRGRLHQVCAVAALPAAAVAVRAAGTSPGRRAAAVYGTALVGVFGVSAAYHRGDWSPRARRRLKRLDHAAIFAFAAASYAPVALVLPPRERRLLTTGVWSGAVVGSAVKTARLEVGGGLADALYLGVGWAGLGVLPALLSTLSRAQLALLLSGGAWYSLGALVLVRRRPDPAPAVFGYHELGHLVMLGGTALHYALELSVLRRE